jgi:hypothetical protein
MCEAGGSMLPAHPSASPRLITGALVVAALVSAGSLGCRRGQAGGKPGSRTVPARGLAAGHKGLAKALRAALADCQVEGGQLTSCMGGAEQELAAQERAAGSTESLRTYCKALEEDPVELRRLSAARLSALSFPRAVRRASSAALFDCLVAGLKVVEPAARPGLARAAALMAGALGGEERLLELKVARTLEVRAAVLRALWANGRLRELPRLEKLLASERDRALKLALIRGFSDGDPLTADEREKVCPLLRARLTDADPALASGAATTHAAACPDEGDQLLAAAEQLAARAGLDAEYLSAVRAVNGFLSRRGTVEQRKRSAALLGKLCEDAARPEPLRSAALEHLTAIDRPAAVKLARRLRAKLGPAPRPTTAPAAPEGQPSGSSLREQVDALLEKR